MVRHIKYSDTERWLAAQAREVAKNRDVLYHGTRCVDSILKMGVLFPSEGAEKVCLTRSAEVAAYWALIERDYDEGCGPILILDRQSLQRRYKIEANPEVYWHTKTIFHDEAEEEIWDTVVDVDKHLIGYVSGPTIPRKRKNKTFNPEFRMARDARFKELLKVKPDLRCSSEKQIKATSKTRTARKNICLKVPAS